MASHFFEGYIGPTIRSRGYKHIVEIGVDAGATTVKLFELAKELDSELICIDPNPSYRPADSYEKLTFIELPSLRALKEIKEIDCVVLDGDHNWYTVFNELKLVDRKLKPGGTIFLHDVLWPYARRDMYYEPKRIPGRFRHPYKKMGIVQGQMRLLPDGINGEYFNAEFGGGSRNGVLTAVEDFLRLTEEYDFSVVEEEFGLGILRKRTDPLDRVVVDYERSFSQVVIERNELRNKALETQAEISQITRAREEADARDASTRAALESSTNELRESGLALAQVQAEFAHAQETVVRMRRSWFWRARKPWTWISGLFGRPT